MSFQICNARLHAWPAKWSDPRGAGGGTKLAAHARMSFLESLRAPASQAVPLQARVWQCFDRGQVLSAAFEVHEAAMEMGFLPEEATTLSLSLAELGSGAVKHGPGGVASVFFSDVGWRLEVADPGTDIARDANPRLRSALPRALSSLRTTPAERGWLVIAEYERAEYQ